MKYEKHKMICVFVCLFLFSQAASAFADRCDDVMDRADQIYGLAENASKQGEYADAVSLYKKAEKYYLIAAKMKKCRCPKIEGNARGKARTCRSHAAQNKQALASLVGYRESIANESYRPDNLFMSCGDKSLVTVQDGKGFVVDSYCE